MYGLVCMCGGMCLYTVHVHVYNNYWCWWWYNSGIVCVCTHVCELILHIQIFALLRMILSDFSFIISVHEC